MQLLSSIPNFSHLSPWQSNQSTLKFNVKTPTYDHLLVDTSQGIPKRNALLRVAGESVNPRIWTCLKIRHAGPLGWKSPRNRRSGSSVLSGSVEVDADGFLGRIRRQTHRQKPPSSAVLCPLAHLWILVYPKKWVQPRPPWALKYEPYRPPTQPTGGKRGENLPLLCLKNNPIPTHPPPALFALSWQVLRLSLCLWMKVRLNKWLEQIDCEVTYTKLRKVMQYFQCMNGGVRIRVKHTFAFKWINHL